MMYEIEDVFFLGSRKKLEVKAKEFYERAKELNLATQLLKEAKETYSLSDIAFAILKGDRAITPEDALINALGFKEAFEANYDVKIELKNYKPFTFPQPDEKINYTLLEERWKKATQHRLDDLAHRIDGVIGILHPFKSLSERKTFDEIMRLVAYIDFLERGVLGEHTAQDKENLKNLYHSILEKAYPYIIEISNTHYSGKHGKDLQEWDEKRLIELLYQIINSAINIMHIQPNEISELQKSHYSFYKKKILDAITIAAKSLKEYSEALDDYVPLKSLTLIEIKQKGEWSAYTQAKREELNLLMQQENSNPYHIPFLPIN
ncbi:MAG: hypothetical protein GXN99_00500 [Candidatus Nanohaloarchaeota archaeon]|nr:hypothetical protein [Candidatus Nanohaloarchaeota archaeon]